MSKKFVDPANGEEIKRRRLQIANVIKDIKGQFTSHSIMKLANSQGIKATQHAVTDTLDYFHEERAVDRELVMTHGGNRCLYQVKPGVHWESLCRNPYLPKFNPEAAAFAHQVFARAFKFPQFHL